MPREFTSQKAIRNHAELTGYVYLWEGTHAFTTRRLLLSPDQYEIVDVRTDRGMTRGHAVPESNPKSRVGCRRAVARRADNQARAMAAIAVGERKNGDALTNEARSRGTECHRVNPPQCPSRSIRRRARLSRGHAQMMRWL
jgi:hypothetical protein